MQLSFISPKLTRKNPPGTHPQTFSSHYPTTLKELLSLQRARYKIVPEKIEINSAEIFTPHQQTKHFFLGSLFYSYDIPALRICQVN